MTTWRDLLADTVVALRAVGIDGADREARWMVEQVSGYDAAELMRSENEVASNRAVDQLTGMMACRERGEPLQYVLGAWTFRGVDLFVDPRVLIPRPETEVTAQHAIDEARRLGACTVVDLGTGSGAIALSVVCELADVEVWATDASEDALAVARANVAGVGIASTRVRVAHGSWFAALPAELRGAIDVIVSNPPYVADAELDALPAVVRDHEPREALVSGESGREALEHLITGAPKWLARPGTLVLELAPHQAEATRAAALDLFDEADVHPDHAGRARVLIARLLG